MCGIVGILSRSSSPPDAAALALMSDCLAHRGPDDRGIFTQGPLALSHRRLTILDLSSAGHQPMSTSDGRFTITFNGEIYNFKELAEKYLSNVPLKSSSDTEVLLHLLAQKRIEALPLLRGMYAFAFWDGQEQQLLLARDPFGKKPLYYAKTQDALIFASEVKALQAYNLHLMQPDTIALTKYFLYEYVPNPATGYKDVKQLEMGEWMDIKGEKMLVGATFMAPKGLINQTSTSLTEPYVLSYLDQLLHQSVARRLVADVPVGILLSGGLDSSAILWYVRQQTNTPLHTFSVAFDEETFDESSYAKQVARQLGTTHHNLCFGLNEFHQALQEVMPLLDIPFADASLLPTYAVCQLARQHVKVVLDGDGSDELFGGYGTFDAHRAAESLPAWLRRLLIAAAPLINQLPTSHRYFPFDFKLKAFLKGLPYPFAQRNQIWLGSFSDKELKELLMPEWQKNISSLFENVDEFVGGTFMAPRDSINQTPTITDKTSLLTIQTYLQNDILVKLDRASMYTSLEARTPFLDVDLAEFALALPEKYKRNKYILKKLMRGRIPDAIIKRPKQGFALPLAAWLAGPLYTWAKNILEPEKFAAQGILNPVYVTRLLAEHHSHRADHRKKLWTLIMFQMWLEKWAQKTPDQT